VKLPSNWDQQGGGDRADWLYGAVLSEKKSDWCRHVAALFERLARLEKVAREARPIVAAEPTATALDALRQALAAVEGG
jgi:hypothetical protein